MTNITGTKGNDTLVGSYEADTIKGLAGNDTITGNNGDNTLAGGGGKDVFVYVYDDYNNMTDTITDFGGVGKGTNRTSAVIAEVDTLKFESNDNLFSARNLLLTQNGRNLEITFELSVEDLNPYLNEPPLTKVILQNFKSENLQNLKASGARPAVGNILFSGQTIITDSFHVFDAKSTDTSLSIKNTVTFLNDLDNNITGLNDSDDVINGQGGNDKIDGKSGNDLLRGGAGNDTLIGGMGKDTLVGGAGDNSLFGSAGDDTLNVYKSQGDNLLSGGDGNDYLFAYGNSDTPLPIGVSLSDFISGNNTLNGGAGKDTLNASFSKGNNTLNGDVGDDTLNANYATSNNLLSGGDGNDYLSVSGYDDIGNGGVDTYYASGSNSLNGDAGNDTLNAGFTVGNNTLNGGTGDDYLDVRNAEGNNLLFGGDGNDFFTARTPYTSLDSLVTQTLDGGIGDDLLSFDYDLDRYITTGITSRFNATTNTGSITKGMVLFSYNNIERLNISGTRYDDLIVGSNGNDTLSSGSGNNTLSGGKGNDTLYGGGDPDATNTFAFNSFNEGVDSIDYFNTTNDLIQVSAAGFGGGLSSGSLHPNQFSIGTSATTSTQRFIYNTSTGGLFFDLDGSASGFTQVKFAQLSAGLSVSNNNFMVV
ncbi:MAG TPA: calcium-binding protein [Nostoc sp.]|uniref:calcium-binding protein n=1 Tax=Nostoc sp. TaxID=1180 RepID=UPI002D6F44B7|nr:calcium-binding protein [Nostoc sp.]HYX15141.1 calcium-binding protein [Nostoc sp.]